MLSLVFIIGVVLTGKENYREWYRKIKSTLIFNNPWKRICKETVVPNSRKITEEEAKSEEEASILKTKSSKHRRKPVISATNKEREIWEDKDQKAYVVISTT